METVDQVLSYAREHNGETTPPWACFMEDGGVDISALLDRLEAAIKREREAVGNAAKMREALEAVVKVGYPYNFQHEAPHISGYCYEITAAIDKCFAALSESPRNCDRFANEAEASKAFIVWYNTVYDLNGDKWNEVSSCDLKHNIDDILHDYIEWLFAEAKGEMK